MLTNTSWDGDSTPPCTHRAQAGDGNNSDKAITMIPPWRYCKLTAHVRAQKGAHEERHQPSQAAAATEGLAITFLYHNIKKQKNHTPPHNSSTQMRFTPFPPSSSLFPHKENKHNKFSSSVWPSPEERWNLICDIDEAARSINLRDQKSIHFPHQ